MSDDYEKKLSEWKAKNGYSAPLETGSIEEAEAMDAALRATDKKLKGEDYCVVCGKGPQPISGMELITRRDDPYIQIDDMSDDDSDKVKEENRCRACPECWREEYGPEEDES